MLKAKDSKAVEKDKAETAAPEPKQAEKKPLAAPAVIGSRPKIKRVDH
jgi:hypothetical protein